jgi:hypothetical protein
MISITAKALGVGKWCRFRHRAGKGEPTKQRSKMLCNNDNRLIWLIGLIALMGAAANAEIGGTQAATEARWGTKEYRFFKGTHYFRKGALLIGEVYDNDGLAILTQYTKLGSPISDTEAKYLDKLNFPDITDWHDVAIGALTHFHVLGSHGNKDIGIFFGMIDTGAGTSSGMRMFVTSKAMSVLGDWEWVPKEN